MPESLFAQIGLILGLAAISGALAQLFRQPLIVAFIIVGIVLGPSVTGLVEPSGGELELFARLGIALLLFVVGLKLDLHVIRTVGPVALFAGVGQVLFTSVIGFFLCLMLGMDAVPAIYVAVALTFSSTIIIVKLLSDKREVDSLHGRIAVGFLIVQDIIVVLAMIGLTALKHDSTPASLGTEAIAILLKGALMLVVMALMMRYVLTPLLRQLARTSELLILFAIAWAVSGAMAGEMLGFSKEVGAFLAGVSIASTPFRDQIAARLVSLRDFLLLFFFIELGSSLELDTIGAHVAPAIVLALFVLIGNPVIVMVIMGTMGYRKRTGFLAGLTVAQISEFSLILAALGASLGHIDGGTVALVTLVGMITITLSTYMILYSQPLYQLLGPYLGRFERRHPHREICDVQGSPQRVNALIIGMGRYGRALLASLGRQQKSVIAVDFDPEVVEFQTSMGIRTLYGDAEDPELLASLPVAHADWIIVTIRDQRTNSLVLQTLRQHGFDGKVAVTAATERDHQRLTELGADLVLNPYRDAADEAAQRLVTWRDQRD